MTRRLAAILAADVVGYSAPMGADQEGTLAALRQLRAEVFDPAVAGHRGKLVKSMGDGWLVEFTSAVDAVTSAMQVQAQLAGHGTIRLRIGIHIGDVVHEDEDVFGDGVNVAARLEALAEPGSVVVSDAVYGSLDGTLKPASQSSGERHLKNIPDPVRVWVHGTVRPSPGATRWREDLPACFPRLAIQPIRTSNERADVRDLAGALTSDLLTYLGNSRWIAARIAEAPPSGAYVLNCVLRTRGDRLRLEASLLDPAGEATLQQRMDGDLAESFDWQDSAGDKITSGIFSAMQIAEKRRLAALPPDQMDAETLFLQACLTTTMQRDYLAEAVDLLRAAIAKAPEWGQLYGFGLLQLYGLRNSAGVEEQAQHDALIEEWLEQASRTLDVESPYRIIVAFFRHLQSPDPVSLRAVLERTMQLSQYNQDVLVMAQISAFALGDPELVIDFARMAIRFIASSAQAAVPNQYIAMASVMLGRDEDALVHAARALAILPKFLAAHLTNAAAHANLGDVDAARKIISAALDLAPGTTVSTYPRHRGWPDTPETRRYLDALRLASLPESR